VDYGGKGSYSLDEKKELICEFFLSGSGRNRTSDTWIFSSYNHHII